MPNSSSIWWSCWNSSHCSGTDCKWCKRFAAKENVIIIITIANGNLMDFRYYGHGGTRCAAARLRGARALEVAQPTLDHIRGRYLINAKLFLKHALRCAYGIIVSIIGAYYERAMHARPLIHCNCARRAEQIIFASTETLTAFPVHEWHKKVQKTERATMSANLNI